MTVTQGHSEDCTFCTEFVFGPGHPDSAYHDYATEQYADRIIFEDSQLMVLPTIGPITAGHTMVLTREHYLSFAHVPRDLAQHAESVAIALSSKLATRFGPVIWFEHGPMSESATGGACTSHAHLHCVPVGDVDISVSIEKHLVGRRIDSIAALSQQAGRDQAYIYYRSQHGEHWAYDVTDPLPCQFLRRITASALGNDADWDWMVCPQPDVVHETLAAVHW